MLMMPSLSALLLVFGTKVFAAIGSFFLVMFLIFYAIKKPQLSGKGKIILSLLSLLVVGADGLVGLLYYDVHYSGPIRIDRITARRVFTLSSDHLHGEVTFPAGSKIYRVDNFDKGDKDYPTTFTDDFVAKLPKPIVIAGILTDEVVGELYPKLILAQDQRVSGEQCSKGQEATFESSDEFEEFLDERGFPIAPLEGSKARFNPSRWKFINCYDRSYGFFESPEDLGKAEKEAESAKKVD